MSFGTVTLTNLSGYNWGIGADETAINIQRFTAKANSVIKEIPNRQSQPIGRADYKFLKKYSITGFVTGSTGIVGANIGALITLANDISLGGVPSGQAVLIDDIERDRVADDLEKITYNMTSYPGMSSSVSQVST